MEIKCEMQPTAKVGFKGYQNKKTNEGNPAYKFNFLYDPNYWECYVEFFKVKQDKHNYSYSIKKQNNNLEPFYTAKLSADGVTVDAKYDLKLKDSEPFAYRYKLFHPESKQVKYAKDDSSAECGDNCNLVIRKGTSVLIQGPMVAGMPDSYNPGYVFAGFHENNTGDIVKDPKAKDLSKFTRTFANKAGGTLAGIMQNIPELKAKGIKRFVGTPATGADNVSAHKYWIKRPNQTDNIDNYDSLQVELFKNGINFVSDSAYTSQGLEGQNFQYAIKWMNQNDKPHEYYRFRMQGLEDAALGLGLAPKNMENLRHKVVNHPYKFEVKSNGQVDISKNNEYDATQPTYIQVYDNSMVSESQRKDTQNLIRDYDKTNATTIDPITGEEIQNSLAINTHDETLVANAFMIDPNEYLANIKNLNAINQNRTISDKIDLNSPMGTLVVSKFSGIEIRPKDEGGFVTWESNTDMAKLSYTESDYDTQMLESIKNPKEKAIEEDKIAKAHAGNRDALVDTMRFWTKHVRQVHHEYTAKTLGKLGGSPEEVLDRINSLIYNRDNQQLPDEVAMNKEKAENIYYNDYILRDKEPSYRKALDKAMMDLPLDSIELADDTVGALSSPYLSKCSPDLEHIGISRYDAMHDNSYVVPDKYTKTYNKMNKVFTDTIHNFATDVLLDVENNSDEKIFKDDQTLTEYGQYVIPLVAGDIVKYAIIKSLVPQAETKMLKNGKLTYDYDNLTKNATLQSMGISGDSPEDEANQIVNKINDGVKRFNKGDVAKLSKSIVKRLEGTNALSFRFAEAMVDSSGLGLDHRLDAAKDVADMDATRSLQDTSDNQLSEVINIWAPACKAVKEENPNSLIIAEFTDLYDTMKATYGSDDANKKPWEHMDSPRFNDPGKLAQIIISESGMNTEANYSHFFTAGLNTLGKDFVKGYDPLNQNDTESNRTSLLEWRLNEFAAMPEDYKKNAYTFGGNHDKPRMTECFGMDMDLFHADLNNRTTDKEINHRKTAYMIMNDILDEKDLNNPDPNDNKHTGWDIIHNSDNYFNNVSSKAIAKAYWLRSSIGIANNIIGKERIKKDNEDSNGSNRNGIEADNNKIYAAYSKSIRDIVNGNYYLTDETGNSNKKNIADTYKKQLEKDGFGTKDILTAFDIVTKHAIAKYDLKNTNLNNEDARKDFNKLFEQVAIQVPAAKVRLYTQMINAIPGNPTVYAGDEFAMTGYEEKNHNSHLNCRNVVPRDVVDPNSDNYKEFIANHKSAMDKIVSTRRVDTEHKMEALNNGTMYVLNTLMGKHVDKSNDDDPLTLKCPALLSQAANGAMNISIFNYNGISLEDPFKGKNINQRSDIQKELNVEPTPVKFNKVVLATPKTETNFDLPIDTIFKNIETNDSSEYHIKRDDNGLCTLVRIENPGTKEAKETPICITKDTAPEGVLRLYHQPKNVLASIAEKKALEKKYTPSFKSSRVYYNPRYNIGVSQPYNNTKESKSGANLSLVAK